MLERMESNTPSRDPLPTADPTRMTLRQLAFGVRIALDFVAASVALATLLGWSSEQWLPGELASHFRLQYLWIALAAAIGLVAIGFRRDAALAALPAFLNFAVILPFYMPTGASPSAAPSLRVASINVYSLNRRHAEVLQFVRDNRPDLVLLLEVTTAWRDLLDALAADYPFQHLELRGSNFGMALFSRLPWKSVATREFGSGGLPSIVARLEWQDEPLVLVGTHPMPPGGSSMWRLRNEQFAQIAAFCRTETDPLVVIGDLNSTSWSAWFDTLLDGTRLRDSRAGFGLQTTWPCWTWQLGITIDHCLVSPEVAVRKRWIGPHVGSDHFPLLLDLAVDPRAAKRMNAGPASSNLWPDSRRRAPRRCGQTHVDGRMRDAPSKPRRGGLTGRASARSIGHG